MATVDDIGTPGAPLSAPPLTEWQAAVRDAVHSLEDDLAGVAAGGTGVWTPAASWADVGGAYGGLYVTRSGPLVAVEGLVKRTSPLVIAANNAYQFGTLPVGFRPTHQVVVDAVVKTGTATVGTPAKLWLLPIGDMHLVPITGGTMSADHDLTVAATFRGA